MKKKETTLVSVLVIIAVLVIGFFLLNTHIYNEKQAEAPEGVSLSGIVVCLPHKGPGPHTKECMMGLMTSDRVHYALDMSGVQGTTWSIADRVTAQGVITPADAQSTYDIAGTFVVSSVE